MITLSIKSNIEDVQRELRQFSDKNQRFIIRDTLNDTAFELKEKGARLIQSQVDRPTPYTKRAGVVRKATVNRHVAVLDYTRRSYLLPLIEGQTVSSQSGKPLFTPINYRLNNRGNIAGLRGGRVVKRLLADPKVFGFRIKGAGRENVRGIFRRTNKNKKLRLLLVLREERRVKKRLYLMEMISKSANAIARKKFRRNIEREFNFQRRKKR